MLSPARALCGYAGQSHIGTWHDRELMIDPTSMDDYDEAEPGSALPPELAEPILKELMENGILRVPWQEKTEPAYMALWILDSLTQDPQRQYEIIMESILPSMRTSPEPDSYSHLLSRIARKLREDSNGPDDEKMRKLDEAIAVFVDRHGN